MRYLSPEKNRQHPPNRQTSSTSSIEQPGHYLAFAIGRRFGNAVERNRARRRLRDAFATAAGFRGDWQVTVPAPIGSYLLTGSRSLLIDDFSHVVANIETCFAKLNNTAKSAEVASS